MFGAFGEFVERVPAGRRAGGVSRQSAGARAGRAASAHGQIGGDVWTGRGRGWRAVDVQPNNAGGSDYVLLRDGQTIGLVRLRVPGLHNVVNSLAALVVADQLGVSFSQVCDSLTEFRGVLRRFEIKGEAAA